MENQNNQHEEDVHVYHRPNHFSFLSKMREQEFLCDITIQVSERIHFTVYLPLDVAMIITNIIYL